MTSIGRRVGALVGAAAMGATALAFGALASAAGAAGAAAAEAVNPCKVIRRSEIRKAFGGTVSTGKLGFGTPASSQCEFTVGPNAYRPSGTVTVHLTTAKAHAAYDALERSSAYAPIDDVPDSLAAAQRHVVVILQGGVLVGVQGGFTITSPLPIHAYDDAAPLTQLARVAASRV